MISIDTRYIDVSENTRPKDKIKDIFKLVLHDAPYPLKNEIENRNYINSLSRQDDIFLSYHYIIGQSGKIINIIPENEIAIHTKLLDFDMHSVSIALCYDKNMKLTNETLYSLKYLSNILIHKYNLDAKFDLIRCYDVLNKREPVCFMDNYYLFYDFKEKLHSYYSRVYFKIKR